MNDESSAPLRYRERTIECPIAWCEGVWVDHGGEGEPPSEWTHRSADVSLLGGTEWPETLAFADYVQFGSEPGRWSAHVEFGPGAFQEHGVAAVVDAMRQAADILAALPEVPSR